MGCDIHVHTEVKIKGEWHHYGQPQVRRSYALFNMLAGVRREDDDPEPIVWPRGLPQDVSFLTQFAYDHEFPDAHDPTWFGVEEIQQLEEWFKEHQEKTGYYIETQFGYLFGNSWGGIKKYRDDYPEELEDVRWVFWFDC